MTAVTVTATATATGTATAPEDVTASPGRFRLSRVGVLNVWQYDDQVFELADGRMLLRGANGAGKSKTLEMLLPFALDGDKLRITASGRHHTSLVWLMTDGHEGNRTGYIWVEFVRHTPDGVRQVLTCGVGIRASSTAKQATSWYFTCPRSVGDDLLLEDEAGPLTKDHCRAAVTSDGQFFERARTYKEHVGRVLFGLEPPQYDELLRLLYWLRQPQIGEDIEPAKLAEQLAHALPQVDDDAIRSAGDTFDELAAFGEQIDRRGRAAEAVSAFATTYAAYARTTAREHAITLLEAHRELTHRADRVQQAQREVEGRFEQHQVVETDLAETQSRLIRARASHGELRHSPEAQSQQRLLGLAARAEELTGAAGRAAAVAADATSRATDAGRRVDGDADALRADLSSLAADGQDVVAAVSGAGVTRPAGLPPSLMDPVLAVADDVVGLTAALDRHVEAVSGLMPGVGELLAAVAVVEETRQQAERASAERDAAERRAAEAERRAEEERGRRADAARAAERAERDLWALIEAWRTHPDAVPVDLPELTAATATGLSALARTAAAPELEVLGTAEAEALVARTGAERSLATQRSRRSEIEAERDPAPAAPALGRTPRHEADGAPLWRLIDFVPGLDGGGRAGLEAALEGAGLLDAWVRRDGAVLDADRRDVVLPVGEPDGADRDLTSVLVPDVPPGCPVDPAVVETVLRRVAVGATVTAGHAVVAVVDVDGAFRLGPLTGRSAKPVAQYIGATARAEERSRRLAETDALIADLEHQRDKARSSEQAARQRRSDLEAWLATTPAVQPVLTAWTRLDERSATADRAQQAADVAETAAARARSLAAERRSQLEALAERHRLPSTAAGLLGRRDTLRALAQRIKEHTGSVPPLHRRLVRWVDDWQSRQDGVRHAESLVVEAAAQQTAAESTTEQHRTLSEAVGADVQELQRRLEAARSEIDLTQRRSGELQRQLGDLREALGAARTAAAEAQERRDEQQPRVVETAHTLAWLHDVPGLPHAAWGHDPDADDVRAVELARGVTAYDAVPRPVVQLARRLAALEGPTRSVDAAGLFAAVQAVTSSDAADHEPRVVSVGPALAALARDDSGEHPVVWLAERLTLVVAHDRELLTERERTLFEEHLIGDLGEVLRQRRLEAADLVEGMNRLLTGVTTSQGIAVRLQWKLRDDVPEDARRAVTLLGQPVGALLPTERAELRDALHRLIEASRAEAPEDGYSEHLARALDYRRWFEFKIRYTRPELDGQWQHLHRRSPLSQGEQKVVCYLPLFAAAAAHFTSLAGAAPWAPRFILLDDAFPKIDVRTHPLLFGLLVDLDLDFVVTSERLWGDHSTLPSLAIYEALRDPTERGIAQYQYLWDGARLQAVGA